MVDPVPGGIISELHTQFVERPFDGVPDAVDQTHVERGGKVRQVLLNRFSLGHVTSCHRGVCRITHRGILVVDAFHQRVELLGRDQAAQTEVTYRLVGQHEVQLILGGEAVRENDDVLADRKTCGINRVEVILRARCRCLLVERGVLGLEVCLIGIHKDVGFDCQLGAELADRQPDASNTQRLGDALAFSGAEAPLVSIVHPFVQERTHVLFCLLVSGCLGEALLLAGLLL